MSEEQQLSAIRAFAENSRAQEAYDGCMDGQAEYDHDSVFDAAWTLAQTAPADTKWAAALGKLYAVLLPESFSLKDPLGIAATRWASPASFSHDTRSVSMDYFQSVRRGLARLALSQEPHSLPQELFHSQDVAFRCAAYAVGTLTPEQIHAGYKKDGEDALIEMVRNPILWRTEQTREALHDVSWEAVEAGNSDLWAANAYDGTRDRMEQLHPDWFRETPAPREPGDEPATKGDLEQLAEYLLHPDGGGAGFLRLAQVLVSLSRRLSWIFWLSLGALVTNFLHF